MTKRRAFLAVIGCGALAAPLKSFAQQPSGKGHRIGFLGSGSASAVSKPLEAFRAGLRDLGYVEGQNIALEYRYADSKPDRLHDLVADRLVMRWRGGEP